MEEGRYRGLDVSDPEDLMDPEEDLNTCGSGTDDQQADPDDDVVPVVVVPQAAIARSRSLPSNASALSQACRNERKLKKKSCLARLSEFPNEYLERRDGSLFCGACREWLSEKKSVIIPSVWRSRPGTRK